MKKIALGSDHAGYDLKEVIKKHLKSKGYEVIDFGTDSEESVDYPDYIFPAAECVANKQADCGIVFGGSGNGEAIAANKVKGIRCAVCWHEKSGELAKQHNNANVIAMGGRMVSDEMGCKIVDCWLEANFEGDRHSRRIGKISNYEVDR
ncbi:MAG TPA: ribose-5-phosphate isomerase [Sunxiuqinia sp.]|nr:ribose-5-phosphate isomerase [Sunxiuqinia sp.]